MTEHDIQAAFFRWARFQGNQDWRFKNIFAIPNGMWAKNKRTVRRMIDEGLEPGVLDVFVAVPVNDYAGLWMEVKYRDNELSGLQTDWAVRLRRAGYCVYVVRSVDVMMDLTVNYLGGKLFRCQGMTDSPKPLTT